MGRKRKELPPDDFWRGFINNLTVNLPDNGQDAPEREILEVKSTKTDLNDSVVTMLRLTLDIYLLQPKEEDDKAYLVQGNQRLEGYPEMTVKEALELIKQNR